MHETMNDRNFQFIVSNGPKVPREAKTVIRKQAMKDVGIARKRKGNHSQVNPRQLTLCDPSQDHSNSDGSNTHARSLIRASVICGSGTTTSGSSSSSMACTPRSPETPPPLDWEDDIDEVVSRPENAIGMLNYPAEPAVLYSPGFSCMPSFSDYERARARFGVDLTDLAALTNFSVGKSTIAILSADPSRLASLLGQQQWSYLEYVPSRYGTSECLTAAANVLLARAHTLLAPNGHGVELCNRLYGTALRALQLALSDDMSAMDADVLCATQLLSVHELLASSGDTAWSQHVNGSARLVKHRSVSRFGTDFEKALFAGHVGIIISEALINDTHCYLDQPEWTELYASMAQTSPFLTDRSTLAIQVRLAFFHLPGLWHDVGECVNGVEYLRCVPLTALEVRCRQLHKEMLDWLENYKTHCVRLSMVPLPSSEPALRRELFGSALECLAIVKRLLATVCEADRSSLETETQALAHLILDLQKQPSPKRAWLFSNHEVGVAYTILLTKDQWEEDLSCRDHHTQKMASRARYNIWSNTLRLTG